VNVLEGRRYDNGEPVRVLMSGDRIAAVEPATPTGSVGDWPWIAPALFDLQINGHGGVWFSDDQLTPEQAATAVKAYLQHGVTRLCPTLVTNSFAALEWGFRAIASACDQDPLVNHMVPGCHLEGPYISSEDGARGAHPKEHVRPADWDEFRLLQDAAGGRIRLVTIAPEVEHAVPFIKQATQAGVVIAIGHTAASPEQIRAAVDAGATLSTHLGNGSAAMIHRHRNHIFEQLADPRLTVSLIADGHHVPASLLKIFLKVKSPRMTVLTCDAAGWAGCPPGIYDSVLGQSEILSSGKLVVAGQTELLAGSADTTDVCITQIQRLAGTTLKEAIDMTSRNPARLLGFETNRLRRGSLADLIVFRQPAESRNLDVLTTVALGQVVFQKR